MGIVIDFEEAKKKLFSPAEQQSSSPKMSAVKNAAEAFLFSRQSLRDRVFMTLRGIVDNQRIVVGDGVLEAVVNELIPYVEMNFKTPYKQPELTNEQTQTTQE